MPNELTFDERTDLMYGRFKDGDLPVYDFTDDFIPHSHWCSLHDAFVKCLTDPCPYGDEKVEIHCQKCIQHLREGNYGNFNAVS